MAAPLDSPGVPAQASAVIIMCPRCCDAFSMDTVYELEMTTALLCSTIENGISPPKHSTIQSKKHWGFGSN